MKKAAPIAARMATTIGTRSFLTENQEAGRKPKDFKIAWPSDEITYAMKALAMAEFFVPFTTTIG
jgi:hypothetical protein